MQNDTDNVNQNLVEEIAAPLYTVKELDIPTRMLTYYDKKDLLYQNKHEANNKRKFSITQAVWLKIVKDLFQFGFSSEEILNIKIRFKRIHPFDITLKTD